MTFLITEAEPCAAVAINRLINAAYRVEDFFKVGDRTHVREVAEFLLNETFITAKDSDDEIVGVVRVSVDGERGHFGMLSVAPEVQGSGLGRTLIEAAEAFVLARGCTWMDLEVASPRVELPPFYRRYGYEVSGRSEWPESELHTLKSPAHFVVMSKLLVPKSS